MAPMSTRISSALNRAVTTACVLFVLAMLAISFFGAAYMMITGDALSWTYSLARLFIPWLGLLSLTVAFWHGEHIAMTALLGLLPHRLVRMLHHLNAGLIALFAGLLVWYGWRYFAASGDIYMVSDTIQIHSQWVTAAVPATGLVLLVHVLCGANMIDERSLAEEARDLAAGEVDNRP